MTNSSSRWKIISLVTMFLVMVVLAACGSDDSSKGASDGSSDGGDSDELTEVTHVLNWFAQPAHAGNYAAISACIYEDHGLDVSIEQGGPQVSATQIVASGNAEFGIANADEVLMAREEGLPLVAVAAGFQDTPQAFAFHEGQDVQTIEDFNNREVFVTPGAGYWEYLKSEYDISDVKEMAHTGSMLNFIANETSIAQVFAPSEPFALEDEGVDVDMLLLKDTGYSLYFNMIFTTEQFLEENPDVVESFVKGSIEGWDYYYDNVDEINEFLKETNSDLDMDLMAKEAEAQKEFQFGDDEDVPGIGYMTKEKWENIQKILADVDVVSDDINIDEVFTTEFLPY